MPEAVEAEEIHFFQRLFSRPFLKGHAVDGGEDASAIIPKAAVHEYFLRMATENAQAQRNEPQLKIAGSEK